jgi:hypothetical protein
LIIPIGSKLMRIYAPLIDIKYFSSLYYNIVNMVFGTLHIYIYQQ